MCQASLKRHNCVNAKPKRFVRIERMVETMLVDPIVSATGTVLVSLTCQQKRETKEVEVSDLVLIKG